LKYLHLSILRMHIKSLSTRRAWIEMTGIVSEAIVPKGRSPRGERGLKSRWVASRALSNLVALHAESVD
jgi:hypothetical protein